MSREVTMQQLNQLLNLKGKAVIVTGGALLN